MKIMESETGKLFYGSLDYASFNDGSRKLHNDRAIPLAQKIHDMLVGQGFTYTHCSLILHLAGNTLREERDTKAL